MPLDRILQGATVASWGYCGQMAQRLSALDRLRPARISPKEGPRRQRSSARPDPPQFERGTLIALLTPISTDTDKECGQPRDLPGHGSA